jgi:hypothetical protein
MRLTLLEHGQHELLQGYAVERLAQFALLQNRQRRLFPATP